MIEMNSRASASVKSEIRASSDLIRETIYLLNLRVMITTDETGKFKSLNLWGSQRQSESPSSSLKGSGHPGPCTEGFER